MLREILADNAPLVLALGGLLIGFVFGAVVYRTNYCAMGSLSDIYNFKDYRRLRCRQTAQAPRPGGIAPGWRWVEALHWPADGPRSPP